MMDFADMYTVSWEHEYFTDDDASSHETLAEAEAKAQRLREAGKRRIRIDGPGIEETDDDDF
jgi:hypothetical protein